MWGTAFVVEWLSPGKQLFNCFLNYFSGFATIQPCVGICWGSEVSIASSSSAKIRQKEIIRTQFWWPVSQCWDESSTISNRRCATSPTPSSSTPGPELVKIFEIWVSFSISSMPRISFNPSSSTLSSNTAAPNTATSKFRLKKCRNTEKWETFLKWSQKNWVRKYRIS